ncbi:MAG: 50S ribosomal protein L19e [Candidatus Micrarchaeia archaeon]|jgi:large subunit ribosomal protein L19e
MTIKFVKRVASEMLGRGVRAIRIKDSALEEAKKALTKDDVRKLIKEGGVYAEPEKHNLSLHGKLLKVKREKGRKRGYGKRRGTAKARAGRVWEKKVRSQRLLLKKLKAMKKLDNKTFNKFYALVKGNAFPDKRSLLLHLDEQGVKVSEDELKQINEYIKAQYR